MSGHLELGDYVRDRDGRELRVFALDYRDGTAVVYADSAQVDRRTVPIADLLLLRRFTRHGKP